MAPLIDHVEGHRLFTRTAPAPGDLAVDAAPALGTVRAGIAGVRPDLARLRPAGAGDAVRHLVAEPVCRLFGLHAGRNVIGATFWLLDARKPRRAELAQPGRHRPGVFGADGRPELHKQPMAAWHDREFACAARS